MRRLLWSALLLLTLSAWAQDSVKVISHFADPFGNTGSFWRVNYEGQPYSVLKLKSPDREGEANFAFDAARLAEFEQRVAELRKRPNTLKADGFEVIWSQTFGDATVRLLLGRLNGVKVKLIQVSQTPQGKPTAEHQISIDQEAYASFQAALRKLKKAAAAP